MAASRSAHLKIKAPVIGPSEIGPLHAAGADLFYAGFHVPLESGEPLSVLDRRGCVAHNVADNGLWLELLAETARVGAQLYLTVNSQVVPTATLERLPRALEPLLPEPGFGGVIAGSLSVIQRLRDCFPTVPIVGSIVLNVFNTLTLDFYRGLGLHHFVLDRSLTAADVLPLTRHAPDTTFEAILFNDHCGNIDGACHSLHDQQLGDDLRTLCQGRFEAFIPDDPSAPDATPRIAKRFAEVYPVRDEACGACLLWRFWHTGVSIVKIAGRVYSTERKIRVVRLAAAARARLEAARDEEDFMRQAFAAITEIRGRKCRRRECLLPFH